MFKSSFTVVRGRRRRRAFNPSTPQPSTCISNNSHSRPCSTNTTFSIQEQQSSVKCTSKKLPTQYLRFSCFSHQLYCHDDVWKELRFLTFHSAASSDEPIVELRSSHCRITVKNRSIYNRHSSSRSSSQDLISTLSQEEWKQTIEGLLDVNIYPVGFSIMPHSVSLVASWCQQVSRVLQQMKSISTSSPSISLIEPALQMLDRLFLEQEAYVCASKRNEQICGGGILMSPDISSTALANVLECWKDSLLEPSSRQNDISLSWERLGRYRKYLAFHEGSLLSQISKVLGPIRRTATSTNKSAEVTNVMDNAASNPTSWHTEDFIGTLNIGGVVICSDHSSNSTISKLPSTLKAKLKFDDETLVGFPLHRLDQSDTTNVGFDLYEDTMKENSVGNNCRFPLVLSNVSDNDIINPLDVNNDDKLSDDFFFERPLLVANQWDCNYSRLIDSNDFPSGFSTASDKYKVDLWYSEVEQLLWQTVPENTKQAFDLLLRWQDEAKHIEKPEPIRPLAHFALHQLLECWLSLLCDVECVYQLPTPEEVWGLISNLHVSYPTDQIKTETALSIIIRSIGQVETRDVAPTRANVIFQAYLAQLSSENFESNLKVYQNSFLILNLLRLWHRSSLPEAPAEADKLLRLLKEWSNTTTRVDVLPNDEIYAYIISIWISRASPGKAIHRAEILINEMQSEPSFVVLGTFIDALAKVGHVERAHTLLNKYIQLQIGKLERRPKFPEKIHAFESCNPILSIFEAYRARLDRQPLVAIVQMERFISQLEKLASDFPALRSIFHPNVSCYNVLIGGYAHLRTPHKAEGLLRHAMRLLNESDDKIIAASHPSNKPVASMFNTVLSALARCNEAECVPSALALVRSMEAKFIADPFYQPNQETYSILLSCIAGDRRNSAVDNARSAQELLERMAHDKTGSLPKPNADCYDIVLRTWCRAGYPDHAEAILLNLCSETEIPNDSKNENSSIVTFPSSVEFLIVMQGWAAVARRRNGHHQVLSRVEQLLHKMYILHHKGFPTKPSATAHNIFLECLAKSEENYAPERAEAFLLMMEKHGKDNPSLSPDVVIYNNVLSTWLRSNRYDSPMKATALFQKMKNMMNNGIHVINATSYITMMGIYKQHALPLKVQEVFDELMQLDESKIRVQLTAYTTLMQSWSLAGKPEKAHKVLLHLKSELENHRIVGPSKDAILSFNSVLKCFVDSKKMDTADEAEDCLELMNLLSSTFEFELRPDHTTYSLVIKSFLYTKRGDASLRAIRIFNQMKIKYMEFGDVQVRPDLNTYTDLFSVLTKSDVHQVVCVNVTIFDQLHTLLEEMDGIVHPSRWTVQGEQAISRMAWHITESNSLSISEKVSLMFKLRRLADQHSVKLDHTIIQVLKHFRQMESSSNSSSVATSAA